MATQYIIDINHNDELPVVIRKCNENFRALLSQRLKQGQITNANISSMIAGVYEALTEEEAERVQADKLLRQLLNSNWFGSGDPTGSRDPSSAWITEQDKLDHAGDLYWSTGTNGAVWYWEKTGSPLTWQWNQLNISGGSQSPVSYNSLTNKPTITEVDLGIIGAAPNRTFGPIGTSTTVTMQGDKSHADYEMDAFTTTELDVIIAMAEAAGPL